MMNRADVFSRLQTGSATLCLVDRVLAGRPPEETVVERVLRGMSGDIAVLPAETMLGYGRIVSGEVEVSVLVEVRLVGMELIGRCWDEGCVIGRLETVGRSLDAVMSVMFRRYKLHLTNVAGMPRHRPDTNRFRTIRYGLDVGLRAVLWIESEEHCIDRRVAWGRP